VSAAAAVTPGSSAREEGSESRREILRLAVPASAEAMLYPVFGLVDQAMVGSLGEAPFAAVGLANQSLFPLLMVNGTLGVGASILVSQYYGKGDRAKVAQITAHIVLVSLVLAIASAVAVAMNARFLLSALGAERAVVDNGAIYLRILSFGLPCALLTGVLGSVLHALGDSRSPMIAQMVGLAANAALDYALIFGTRLNAPMGIAGAAWASAIARTLPLLILLGLIVSSRRLSPFFWGAGPRTIKREWFVSIGKLAAPLAGSQIAWTAGGLAYAGLFTRLGTQSFAASHITQTIEVLALMPAHGLAVAGFAMVGHGLGARDHGRVRANAGRIVRAGSLVSAVLALLLCSSYFFVHAVFPGMEERTITLARWALLLCAITLPLKVLNNVFINGVLRGGGDTRFIFAVDAISVLVGVPLAWLLAYPLGAGFLGVVIGRIMEELVRCCLSARRFRGSSWYHMLAA
jgi:putative MATE family efflux protein